MPESLQTRQCRIALLTHGTESASLGGPTVRVPKAAQELRSRGYNAVAMEYPNGQLENVELIHGFNAWPPDTSLALAREARRRRKPYVFSPIFLDHGEVDLWHNLIPRLYREAACLEEAEYSLLHTIEQFNNRKVDGQTRTEFFPGHHALLRETIALADHIVLLSERERVALSSIGARLEAHSIIRNPVDAGRYDNSDPKLFGNAFNVRDYVLCIARIEPRKNQLLLLQALYDTGLPVVLIGGDTESPYADIIRKLAPETFRMIGRIDPASPLLASAIAGARVFVLPSWAEGAPLSALEAAAAGIPLVLSDRSSEREYFGDLARYCDPADPNSIRRAVLEAYESCFGTSDRLAMREYVANNFNWSRHIDASLIVYNSVVSRRDRSTNWGQLSTSRDWITEKEGYLQNTIADVTSDSIAGIEFSGWGFELGAGRLTRSPESCIQFSFPEPLYGQVVIMFRATSKDGDTSAIYDVVFNERIVGTLIVSGKISDNLICSLPIAETEGKRSLFFKLQHRLSAPNSRSSTAPGLLLSKIALIAGPRHSPIQEYLAEGDDVNLVGFSEEISFVDVAAATGLMEECKAADTVWGARVSSNPITLRLRTVEPCRSGMLIRVDFRAVATKSSPLSASVIINNTYLAGNIKAISDEIASCSFHIPHEVVDSVYPLVVQITQELQRSPASLGIGIETDNFGIGLLGITLKCDDARDNKKLRYLPSACLGKALQFGNTRTGSSVNVAPSLVQHTWHNREETGRWTCGPEGRLILSLSNTPRKRIGIRCSYALPGFAFANRVHVAVQIVVNSKIVALRVHDTAGSGVLIGELDDPWNGAATAILNVSIMGNSSHVPYQHNSNAADDRVLGVFVTDLIFEEWAALIFDALKPSQKFRIGGCIDLGPSGEDQGGLAISWAVDTWQAPQHNGRWTHSNFGCLLIEIDELSETGCELVLSVAAGNGNEFKDGHTLVLRINGVEAERQQSSATLSHLSAILTPAALSGRSRIAIEVQVYPSSSSEHDQTVGSNPVRIFASRLNLRRRDRSIYGRMRQILGLDRYN